MQVSSLFVESLKRDVQPSLLTAGAGVTLEVLSMLVNFIVYLESQSDITDKVTNHVMSLAHRQNVGEKSLADKKMQLEKCKQV